MKLLKEMLVYTGTSVIEKIVPLLLLPVLTRILTPEDYGLVSVFIAIVGLLVPMIGMSLDGFIRIIFHKVDTEEFGNFVNNTISIFLFSWIVAYLIGLAIYTFSDVSIGGKPYLIFVSITAAGLQFIVSLRLTIYQTSRNVRSFAAIQIFRASADVVFVAILVLWFFRSGEARIFAYLLSFVTIALISLFSLRRDGLLSLDWQKKLVIRSLSYSLPLVPHTVALAAVFSIDKLILSNYESGIMIIGYLSVSLALSSPTMLLANALNKAFMPWALNGFKENRNHDVVAVSYLLIAVVFIFCLIYSFIVLLTFDYLVGSEFVGAKIPSAILCWVGFFKYIYYTVAKGLLYSEAMKRLPTISLAAGAVYLASIWLLLWIGYDVTVYTVAYLMLFYHLLVSIVTAIISQQVYYQPWVELTEVMQSALMICKSVKIRK